MISTTSAELNKLTRKVSIPNKDSSWFQPYYHCHSKLHLQFQSLIRIQVDFNFLVKFDIFNVVIVSIPNKDSSWFQQCTKWICSQSTLFQSLIRIQVDFNRKCKKLWIVLISFQSLIRIQVDFNTNGTMNTSITQSFNP